MRYVLAFLAALVIWVIATCLGVFTAMVVGVSAPDYHADTVHRLQVGTAMALVAFGTTTIFALVSIGIAVAAAANAPPRMVKKQ